MKTRFVIEFETKNLKQFVPEEGTSPEQYSKSELKECNEEVEKALHTAVKAIIEEILEETTDWGKKKKVEIVDVLEELVIENGDELPECECFEDIANTSFNLIEVTSVNSSQA